MGGAKKNLARTRKNGFEPFSDLITLELLEGNVLSFRA